MKTVRRDWEQTMDIQRWKCDILYLLLAFPTTISPWPDGNLTVILQTTLGWNWKWIIHHLEFSLILDMYRGGGGTQCFRIWTLNSIKQRHQLSQFQTREGISWSNHGIGWPGSRRYISHPFRFHSLLQFCSRPTQDVWMKYKCMLFPPLSLQKLFNHLAI